MIMASHTTGVLLALAGWAQLIGIASGATVITFLIAKRYFHDRPRRSRRAWPRPRAASTTSGAEKERSGASGQVPSRAAER
jgi:hypothetical protein